ncbi:hypothetical protein ACPW96_20205 [Micromonospora sp. DT81.3]|uniref:hypothetical protein n=1 Tax=Micromonospora sp. DT81.3 TaxID=3416523 RepID=UPI003CFB62E3
MWWSRTVFWLRIGAALFAGAVGVLAVLDYYGVITLLPSFEPIVWSISLAIIAVDNIGSLISRGIRARVGRRNERIEKALMGLMISLVKNRSLRFEDLGVSVYVPWWRDRFRRRPHMHVRLKRIVRYRPAGYPPQSGVSWTPGKGVVGEAWSRRKTRHKNWHAIAARYAGQDITEDQFLQIPEATRYGFAYEEFVSIVGKYSEVLAEPIWHGWKDRVMVGVLAIDRPYKAEEHTFRTQLDKKPTLEVAAASASTVGGILKPKADGA